MGCEFGEILHEFCALRKRWKDDGYRSVPWGTVAQQGLTDEDTPKSSFRAQTSGPELAADLMAMLLSSVLACGCPTRGDRIPLSVAALGDELTFK